MKLIFLGTAAGDRWPQVFCPCEFCRKIREVKGKNLRTRSSLQFGDEYKVDFPPDSYLHMIRHNLFYDRLRHLFITHPDKDHLYPFDLRRESRRGLTGKLHIYGNKEVCSRINDEMKGDLEKQRIILEKLEPFKSFQAGDLEVVPILANHSPCRDDLNYIFKIRDKVILQAFDTGWYSERTWDYLTNFCFDLVIHECTLSGVNKGGHTGIETLPEVKKKMEKMKILCSNSLFIATHFGHHIGLLHEELEKKLRKDGIIAAYDGMELEV